MRSSLAILPLLAATGCVIQGDRWPRPRDLSPTWLIDRPRVLAIQAEPPELRPGERATFNALLPTPGAGDFAIIWLACPFNEGGDFSCALDLGTTDFETASPQELAELGLIGFEPGLAPAYTAPLDLLDELPQEDRAEGTYVTIQTTAMPLETLEAQVEELDFNEIEVGTKRLIVSEASTPNHNPALKAFTVDREPVQSPDPVHVRAGASLDLGILLQNGAREAYQYINGEGVAEDRIEEPYASWFSTGGEVTEAITLHPYMESTWIAPERKGHGTWYVVVRDRRGGMSWWVQDWVVD